MNAIELANELENTYPFVGVMETAVTTLRQQAKEIEQLKADVAGWMDTAIGKTPDEGYWLNLFKKASEKWT